MLHKLKHYGLNLPNGYLSNCKQYVQIEYIKSSLGNFITGVPRCPILGPLLFKIHIYGINILRLLIYADDTTLYGTIFFTLGSEILKSLAR